MKNIYLTCKLTKFKEIIKTSILFFIVFLSNSSLQSQNLKLGLEGYWPFECSPMDVSGGRHAVFEGAPICTDGKFSKAFTFNGTADFAKLPNNNTAPLYAKEGFSWCVWFNGSDIPTSTADGYGQILISAADGGLGEDIILGFGNAYSAKNTLFFEVDSAGGFGGVMTQSPGWKPAAGWENNRWYHAVAVADYPNKVIILYVDGIERARKDFGGIPVDRNMNVSFGAFFDGSDRQGRFKGIMDDIRIYSRALSPEDVTALYELNVAQLAVSTDEIDFGTLICEYTSSSTFSISNAGPGDVEITDAIFSSGANFSLTNSIPADILGGTQSVFELVFTATAAGIYRDTLLLDNSLGLPPIIIHLTGQKDSLGVWTTTLIDFGKLENGNVDTKQAAIVNTGTVPFDVRSIAPLGVPFAYSLVNTPVPTVLNPGDTLKIDVTFTAAGGIHRDTLKLNAETDCGDRQYKIPIVGEGSYRAFITLEIPDTLKAYPGDIVSVPIIMTRHEFIQESGVKTIKAKLQLNPTLLITTESTPEGILEDDKLIVEVEFQCEEIPAGGKVAEFKFIAALGDKEFDAISFAEASPVEGLATIETYPGQFTQLGVCKDGEPRLFSSLETLQLLQSKPNPAEGKIEIEFEVIEKGFTELYIINADGLRVLSVLNRLLEPGRYSESFSTSALPAGTYFYILKTPSDLLSKKMQIIK